MHEDIYVILRDACKEMMPADLAAKTLAFYTGLVEHFFGLKKRTPEEVRTLHIMPCICLAAPESNPVGQHRQLPGCELTVLVRLPWSILLCML